MRDVTQNHPAKMYVAIEDCFDRMAYRMALFNRVDGKRQYARIEWVEYESFSPMPADCAILLDHENPQSKATLQSMLDQLWGIGFRPSRRNAEDHITAQGLHIGDLQKVMYQLLNKVAGKDNG